MIIIGILLILLLGAVGGFRLGCYFIRRENETILQQNMHLQEFSNQWAHVAKFTTDLSGSISQQNIHNTNASIATVIQLLQNIQQKEADKLSSQDQEKISLLVNQAKQLSGM